MANLRLNRQQLAQFLPNHEAIKAFEALFANVQDVIPTALDDVQSTADNATLQAAEALSGLAQVANALSLALYGTYSETITPDNYIQPNEQAQQDIYNPPLALGSMAEQNADKVNISGGSISGVSFSGTNIVAPETHAATTKATPVDADELPLSDSAASFNLKKLTWANLKTTLAAWIGGNLIGGSFTTLAASGLISANGGQIKFPAAQAPSADPNTLDDYEEGTWTPAINFGTTNSGTTYSAQVGRYTKIGNRVFFTALVALSSKGTSTGSMSITGLPFTVNASSSNLVPAAARFQTLAAGIAHYSASLPLSSTQIYLEKFSAGATNFLSEADITNTSSFCVSGHYEI